MISLKRLLDLNSVNDIIRELLSDVELPKKKIYIYIIILTGNISVTEFDMQSPKH